MMMFVTAAWADPSPKLSCEVLAERFAAIRLPERPKAPTYWWLEQDPCPGGALGGPPPPAASQVWCAGSEGQRTGPSTTLSADLKVMTETRYYRDTELGPRIDWNPATGQAVAYTPYRGDVPHGIALEWSDSGTVAHRLRKGVNDGPTWKVNQRGGIEFIEYWSAGDRLSRNCAWRDGALVIDVP